MWTWVKMRAAGGQNTKWPIHMGGKKKMNVTESRRMLCMGLFRLFKFTPLSIKKASYIFMVALASTKRRQCRAASKTGGMNK